MNIYALSSLMASYICFSLGVFIYQKDPKNKLNRIFMLSCMLLGCLAFAEFGLREAADAAAARKWIKISAFWPLTISVYLHFVLVFTKSKTLQKKVTYFLLYVPSLLFAVLELTTESLVGAPEKEYWGWTYSIPEDSLMYTISAFWFAFLAILPLILCFLYLRRTEEPVERRRAKLVFVSVIIPAVAGLGTEGILPAIDIRVPEFTVIASACGIIIIAYGIHRYNIFTLTPSVAADNIVTAMSNLLFLTRNDGSMSLANESALTLLGCSENELVGQPLQRIFSKGEWEKIEKAINQGRSSNLETAIMTKDGRMIPVILSTSVIKDKYGNNLGILCVGSDLTDHKQAEEAQKKEVLLKEIHHRVKNNMQIISSLLRLQSRYITDEKYKEMFKESQNRIQSMALIHEKLYKTKDLETINFREYITDMVHRLVRSYSQDITVIMEVDDISFDVDAAVPCGLIINELVTNALKHAFPEKKGAIKVGLHKNGETIQLIVSDNGIGLPEDIDFETTDTLGLRLVTLLTRDQLEGEIGLIRNKGTEFHITLSCQKEE